MSWSAAIIVLPCSKDTKFLKRREYFKVPVGPPGGNYLKPQGSLLNNQLEPAARSTLPTSTIFFKLVSLFPPNLTFSPELYIHSPEKLLQHQFGQSQGPRCHWSLVDKIVYMVWLFLHPNLFNCNLHNPHPHVERGTRWEVIGSWGQFPPCCSCESSHDIFMRGSSPFASYINPVSPAAT